MAGNLGMLRSGYRTGEQAGSGAEMILNYVAEHGLSLPRSY